MVIAGQPPGPRGRFLLGNSVEYFFGPLEFFTRCAREYGDVVQVRLLPWAKTYLLFHPDYIEEVLRHDHKHFIKDRLTHQLSTLLGNGLLTNEGDDWRRQRRLIQPAFQHARVERYAEIMVLLTAEMLQSWPTDQVIEVHEEMSRLTLRIVAHALFHVDVSREAQDIAISLDAIMAYFQNPVNWPKFRQWIPTPGVIRFRRAVRRLDRIIHAMIERRRNDASPPEDLLTALLRAQDEDGSQMSNQQLRDELMTLLLAGHETTALALSYSLYLLADAPEVVSQLQEEVSKLSGLPTPADLPRLKYTEQVIKESMRLYPPAWTLGREALVDCEIGGFKIPKGAQIDLPQWVVHRDPRWYPEPERFLPSRWAEDDSSRPRCAYFPFGDGPRICVGNQFAMLEAILVLATIMQKLRPQNAMRKPLAIAPSITLRPKNGIQLRFVQ